MDHIDIFSGICGFAYAARQVWGDDYHNVLFCDTNKFCQQVIKKNFGKDSVIYGDIRDVTYANWNRLQEQGTKFETGGDRQLSEITLLTGGFPCQPFSCAGKHKGTDDDRYLWPEMFRVIRDFKPTWIIAENVRGLLTIEGGLVFEQVCVDLEGEGYEVQPFVIPACAVNAPHRRDRVWIVANCDNPRSRTSANGTDGNRQAQDQRREKQPFSRFDGQSGNDSNSKNERLQGCKQADRKKGTQSDDQLLYGRNREWDRNWLEVATELCGVDDGLPCELDGFKLTKAGHRVERLKALGNAIVPQVAIEIMRAIKNAELFTKGE